MPTIPPRTRPKPPLQNTRLLRALARQPVDRTPVWIMRQAGRYLPEYRAVRARMGSFLDLCHTPKAAAEVTLQPVNRFGLDAAILFTDILVIAESWDLGLSFEEGVGPVLAQPLESPADLARLAHPRPLLDAVGYVMDTITEVQTQLAGRVPLIGFCGSPWTVATYLIAPAGKAKTDPLISWRYQHPEAVHALLECLTIRSIAYLEAQVAAGVDVLMIFDSWGGVLSAADYWPFSAHYLQRIVSGLAHTGIPILLFPKGPHALALAETGCHGIGLDWTYRLGEVRHRIQGTKALQGNLDPSALYADPPLLRDLVAAVLADYGAAPGHIFNLGHGITPGVDPAQVARIVAYVAELSPAYHAAYQGAGTETPVVR